MGYTGMHTPDKYPGLHACESCGLELDADDHNTHCGGVGPMSDHTPSANPGHDSCAHGIVLASLVGGPNNHCPDCERAGRVVFTEGVDRD